MTMNLKDKFYNTGKFNYSGDSYDDAKVVILGLPMDSTVSFMSGTREGASSVRLVSRSMEEYSPKLDRELSELNFYDLGDLEMNLGNSEHSLAQIEETYDELIKDGKIPFAFGGEHLVTYPIIKSFAKKYEDLVVIHLDAHGDMRESFFGEELSHATVLRHSSKLLKPKHLYQVGIRSGPKEEFLLARKQNRFYPFRLEEALPDINEFAKDKPVYITLDIDVLDPAYAPGVGTAEPQGVTGRELFDFIYNLKLNHVVGIDVVEISPYHDPARITSVFGANLFREMALKFF